MCVPVCVVLGGKNTRESGQDLSRVSVTINPKVEKLFFSMCDSFASGQDLLPESISIPIM